MTTGEKAVRSVGPGGVGGFSNIRKLDRAIDVDKIIESHKLIGQWNKEWQSIYDYFIPHLVMSIS